MKLLKKTVEKDGSGVLSIQTQNAEDLWHLWNLVTKGDRVTNTTFRKVVKTTATGTTTNSRKQVTLTIEIEDINYTETELRLKGKTTTDTEHVKRGSYHTLTIGTNDTFQLSKDKWDAIFLQRVDDACNPNISADVAAVILQSGTAHVCLITNNRTIVRSDVNVVIPKKRAGSANRHDQGVDRFYATLATAVEKHVDFDVVKCLIIASPAHYKEEFVDYFLRTISNDKQRANVKSKILSINSTSGHLHALSGVLQDPDVKRQIDDTKAFKEAAKLGEFLDMLNSKPDWAFFGVKHCSAAADQSAIDTLLVTDGLFRSEDPGLRTKYVELTDKVRDCGGKVFVFSSEHETGRKLDQLSGVAAILRQPLPSLHDLEMDDPENYDSEDHD